MQAIRGLARLCAVSRNLRGEFILLLEIVYKFYIEYLL